MTPPISHKLYNLYDLSYMMHIDLYPDSDLLEAIELIQDDGNLIFNFKFITIASRLWMQVFRL